MLTPSSVSSSALTPPVGEPIPTSRKRFQEKISPHFPMVLLNAEGIIVHATPTTRRLLEYRTGEPLEPYFFSHVHSKNLRQIMRDIGAMKRVGKKEAFRLARLRTARGQWSWFKITAQNRLDQPESVITLSLRDLRD